MTRVNQILIIFMTIVAGVVVQGIYYGLESRDTPNKAAIEFAKAYVAYDGERMSERLCDEKRIVDDADVVKGYVYDATKEARERGYSLFYLKDCLYHATTETLKSEPNKRAQIRLTGERRGWLRSFFTGESEHFEETFEVIWVPGKTLGQGSWKVCDTDLI